MNLYIRELQPGDKSNRLSLEMKKAYLETSAINKFCNEEMSGDDVRRSLASHSLLPVVGVFTTFELAKTFLRNDQIERGKKLFLLIKELNPEYTFQSKELFLQESWKLKYNLPVNPILDSLKLNELNLRIEKLSNGNMDDSLRDFVEEKSKNIEESRLLWNPQNYNPLIKRFNEFSDYKTGFLKNYDIDSLKEFLSTTAEIKLHNHHLTKLMENINDYPVLRTHIYHHLHLNFISKKDTPAKDRIPDNIHLKNASYFPVFISNDTKHLEYAKEINPDIQSILPPITKFKN